MNFLHILTVIFVIAKLLQVITWSWWVVLAPSIFSFILGALILLAAVWVYLK